MFRLGELNYVVYIEQEIDLHTPYDYFVVVMCGPIGGKVAKKRIRNGNVRERECLACGKRGKERGATKIIKELIKVNDPVVRVIV